jgi:hypothetical protein
VLKTFKFGGYTLDVARSTLRAEDREIELRRKSFNILNYLASISMPRNLPNIASIAPHMSQRADPVHLATE